MSDDDNNDNELTDIRQLPDLDESVEESFESLDEIAHNMGLTEPPEFPTPPSSNDDSPPDFNFQEQEETNAFESDFSDQENEFESNDNDFEASSESEDSFESDNSSFDSNESEDFNSDFGDENELDNQSADNDFSSDSNEFEDNSFSDSNDDEENDFNDFGSDETSDDSFETDNESFDSNEDSFLSSEDDNDFSSSDNDSFEASSESDFESSNDEEENFESNDFNSNDDETDFSSETEDNDFNSEDNSDNEFGDDAFSSSEDEFDAAEEESESVEPIDQEPVSTEPESNEHDIRQALQEKAQNENNKSQVERVEQTHSTPPEDFEEFKTFAQNMVSDNFAGEGNPPFSIILKDIRYHEDASDILELLIENKIITEEDTEKAKDSLLNGRFLIPRLSEFAAIYLCHQLRRFDVEILMGLTEEVHPPKSYESNDRGLASRRTIKSNKKHNLNLDDKDTNQEILTTTLPQLTDHKVRKYIGIVTEIKNIKPEEISSSDHLENEIIEQVPNETKDSLELLRIKRENKLASESKFGFRYSDFYQSKNNLETPVGLESIYAELISKIKLKAKIQNANGIIGISFNITPVVVDEFVQSGPTYQVLCTGNMVWLEKS